MQRDAQLFIGTQQFRINIIQTLGHILFAFGRRVVGDILVIDFRKVDMRPLRLFHFKPATVGFEAPFEHELGLLLDR